MDNFFDYEEWREDQEENEQNKLNESEWKKADWRDK